MRLKLTIDTIDDKTLLLQHKNLFCYAIPYAEQYPELMHSIYASRKESFNTNGFSGDSMTDHNKGAQYSYQIILFDNDSKIIIAGYVINLVNETVENLGWQDLWLSRTFSNLSEIIVSDAPTLMLEHSFVSPIYQKKSLALLLLWRGLNIFFSQVGQACYLVGTSAMPFTKYPKKVYSLYVSCLRNSHYYIGNNSNTQAISFFDETQNLPSDLINKSKNIKSFNEMESLIFKETGVDFKIPVLVRKYTEHFMAQILNFSLCHNSSALRVLQFAKYKKNDPHRIVE